MQALTEPKLPPTNKKSTVLIIKSNYEKNYYSKDKKHSVKNTCNLLHFNLYSRSYYDQPVKS